MSNGGNGEVDRLKALEKLYDKAIGQWNERRKYEWMALAQFVIFVGAIAKVILDATLNISCCGKIVLTVLFVLACGAIIWFLAELQRRNESHDRHIRDLHNEILDLVHEQRFHL